MQKLLLFYFFIFFSLMQALAFNKKIVDSLHHQLEITGSAEHKINILNELAWQLRENEATQALEYINQAIELSKKEDSEKQLGKLYNTLGGIYNVLGKYHLALNYYKKSLAIRIEEGNPEEISSSYNNLGVIYLTLGEYVTSLEYLFNALKIDEEVGEKRNIAIDYNNIGIVHENQQKYKEALKYYTKSLKIRKELKDIAGYNRVLNNIGIIYQNQGRYDDALECFKKCLKLSDSIQHKYDIAFAYDNLGETYNQMGLLDSALFFKRKALVFHKDLEYQLGMIYSLMGIGNILDKQGHHEKAIFYLNRSKNIAEELGTKEELQNIFKFLSEAHENKGDLFNALNFHKKHTALKDSILNEKNAIRVTQMQALYETEKKEKEIRLLNKEKEKQNVVRNALVGVLSLVFVMVGLLFNRNRIRQKANRLLSERNREINKQKDIIEKKNKDITDSITYAQQIQEAILLSQKSLKDLFNDVFIVNKPRDIISGDFYWVYQTPAGKIIWAVADCTGHGVPGALMSMIGNALLNEAVIQHKIESPEKVLNYLRKGIIESFKEKGSSGEAKDGMDIAICCLDPEEGKVLFSGAMNPLYIIRQGELTEIKGDRQPAGYYTGEQKPFTLKETEVKKGDLLYLFTDGFPDQFGGERGKKFTYKKFKQLIININMLPLKEQKGKLEQKLSDWKKDEEQIDDILILGVKI